MTVTFPRWIYYADGYGRTVSTAAELAHLPPGYASSYVGPFLETEQGLAWEVGKGPFAPYMGWGQANTGGRYTKHSVYACRPLVANGVAYMKGEVFDRGTLEIEELIEAGHVKPCPPGAQFVRHDRTSRLFLGTAARDAYARRYETRDLSGMDWFIDPPPDTTPTLEAEAVLHRGPGRPRDAEWRTWTFEYLLEMLKDGWQKACRKYPEKKQLSFENVAECVGHSRWVLSESLKKHHHTWETIRPFLKN
jgi:hypothetical protein